MSLDGHFQSFFVFMWWLEIQVDCARTTMLLEPKQYINNQQSFYWSQYSSLSLVRPALLQGKKVAL